MMSAINMRDIEIKLATPEDALALVDFRNTYYRNRMGRQPEHWLWQYNKHHADKSVFVFGQHNRKIVATLGAIPVYMNVGPNLVLGAKSEDLLVLPEYRGILRRRIYQYFGKLCRARGIQFLWAFTSVLKSHSRLGVTTYPDIEVWTRPSNLWIDLTSRFHSRMPLWRRVGSVGKVSLHALPIMNHLPLPQLPIRDGYQMVKGQISEEGLRELHERSLKVNKDTVCINYNQKYLSWRVREHPFLKYDEYQIFRDSRLCGYAIVVVSQGTASISDLFSDDTYAISLLLYTIIRDYSKTAGRFRFLGNLKDRLEQNVYSQLSDFGFTVDKKTSKLWTFVTWDLSGGKYRQIFDIQNWHISSLWTEGFLY